MDNFEWLKKAVDEEEFYYDARRPFNFDLKGFAIMPLIGCELILTADGKWTMNDTSGG